MEKSSAKNFVLVIDAGHGGHDPGAIGKISKEKNINLNVALRLGSLISNNCPDVKLIYTRKTDVFIPLDTRADIANNAKADLFISIHTNALAKNHTYKGASTWTLGLARTDENLDVAKRENSVILYENDYKTRYAGFDPNSAESYIIFEFMQDKYMSQSVHLASLVQKEFKNNSKRIDQGVHQAGFLVLRATAMPSILVELGFITTPDEEQYLNTEAGINSLANSIFRAFLKFKREQEIRLKGSSNTIIPDAVQPVESAAPEVAPDTTEEQKEQPKSVSTPTTSKKQTTSKQQSQTSVTTSDDTTAPVFKIQITTSDRLLSANAQAFKGLKGVEHYKEGGLYKYTYGSDTDYNKINSLRRSIADKFKGCFIIAFKQGEKVNVNDAISEFKLSRRKN